MLLRRLNYLLSLVTIFMVACSSTPSPPPPLAFTISTPKQTNSGGLFYMVARTANEKQFMLDTYKEIAGKAFSDPPDPNILGVFSIVPGTEQLCEINPPAQGTMALYFLFTQPGSQWKKLLSEPLAKKYRINFIGINQVDISEDNAWFSWF